MFLCVSSLLTGRRLVKGFLPFFGYPKFQLILCPLTLLLFTWLMLVKESESLCLPQFCCSWRCLYDWIWWRNRCLSFAFSVILNCLVSSYLIFVSRFVLHVRCLLLSSLKNTGRILRFETGKTLKRLRHLFVQGPLRLLQVVNLHRQLRLNCSLSTDPMVHITFLN